MRTPEVNLSCKPSETQVTESHMAPVCPPHLLPGPLLGCVGRKLLRRLQRETGKDILFQMTPSNLKQIYLLRKGQ